MTELSQSQSTTGDPLVKEYRILIGQYIRSNDIDELDDLLDKLDHIWYVRATKEQRVQMDAITTSYDEYDYNTYMKHRGDNDDTEADDHE